MIQEIEFFKSKTDIRLSDFSTICLNLEYEYYKKNQIVFDYGSYGNKFYIIIKGKVSVLIPSPQEGN